MPEYQNVLENLIIQNQKDKSNLPIYFVFNGPEYSEKLFLIGRTRDTHPDFKNFIQTLVDLTQKNYFLLSENRWEDKLESTLSKVNTDLQQEIFQKPDLTRDINLENELQKLDLLTGAIKNNTFCFSLIGALHVFLVRDNEILDLAPKPEADKTIQLPHLFNQIISGRLKSNDGFLFCFDDLMDYFSTDKIKEILLDYSPSRAAQYFKELLSLAGDKKLLLAGILKISLQKTGMLSLNEFSPRESVAKKSMDQLLNKQRNTQTVMHPKIKPALKELIKTVKSLGLSKKINGYLSFFLAKSRPKFLKFKQVKFNVPKISQPHLKIPKPEIEPAKIIPIQSVNKLKNSFLLFSRNFLNLTKKVSEPLSHSIKKVSPQIDLNLKKIIFYIKIKSTTKIFPRLILIYKYYKNKFEGLPLAQKRKVIARTSIGLLLILGILIAVVVQINLKNKQFLQKTLQEIKDYQNTASAALIYHDESSAQKDLKIAEQLLNEISKKKADNNIEYQTLKQKNEQMLNQIRKIANIAQSAVFFDFSNANEKVEITNLLLAQNNLYFINSTNQTLNKIDLKSKKNTQESEISNLGNIQSLNKLENNSFILTTQNQKIWFYDLEKKSLSPLQIDNNLANLKINRAIPYSNKLYLLNASDNQIYKFTNINNTFQKPAAWITNNGNLAKMIDFSIDGNIWTIAQDNKVSKFFNGLKESWCDLIDPMMQNPLKIYTEIDHNYLYIFDQGTKRIIILYKDGKIYKQFQSEQWNNIKDWAVNTKSGIIYLLQNNKIFEVKIK